MGRNKVDASSVRVLSDQERALFREALWGYYHHHARYDLPWRQAGEAGSLDPYKVLVSELMLQQTQVSRVIPKYTAFLDRFPDVQTLAGAELGDVLRQWQGLGYNRRAKFLWQAASGIAHAGTFPKTLAELVALPGIGPNTAGAILAYTYNQPIVFIETNIRSVYLYHFFTGEREVGDKEILELVAQTLPGAEEEGSPREFYWALMDYGSHLKATVGNPNKASRQYMKQSVFHGSRRQIRGQVIRELGGGAQPLDAIRSTVADERLEGVLDDLLAEGLIRRVRGRYCL